MGYERWGPLYSWLGLPGRPVSQPVFAGCTWWLCGRRFWLVTKSALEVCIRDDALYKLQPLLLPFYLYTLNIKRKNQKWNQKPNRSHISKTAHACYVSDTMLCCFIQQSHSYCPSLALCLQWYNGLTTLRGCSRAWSNERQCMPALPIVGDQRKISLLNDRIKCISLTLTQSVV